MEDDEVRVTARLSVWRVYGLHNRSVDRPDDERSRRIARPVGPRTGDETVLWVGDIPSELLETVKDHRAQIPYAINQLTGNIDPGTPWAEVEARMEAQRCAVKLDDVVGEFFNNWLTIRVSRTLEVNAVATRSYQWCSLEDTKVIEDFGNQASQYIDHVFDRIAGQLAGLGIDIPLFVDDRAYVSSEGRRAFALPRFTGSVKPGGVTGWVPWAQMPIAELESRLDTLTVSGPSRSVLTGPSRWYTLALTEHQDPLRRFFFAFFGIEMLVGRISKCAKKSLVDRLSEELNGVPLAELIWPSPAENESPWRSLMFDFACAATVINRESAANDVARFRELQRVRNRVAHGGARNLEDLPAIECMMLFGELLANAAQAEADGVLESL